MSNNIARFDQDSLNFALTFTSNPTPTRPLIPHAAPEPETEQPSPASPPDNNTLQEQAIETNQATPPVVSDTIQGAPQDASTDPKEAAPIVAPATDDAAANPDEQKAGLKEQAVVETNQATPAMVAQGTPDASSDLKEAAAAASAPAPAPAAAPAATGNAAANPFRAPGMSDEEKAERAKYAAPVAVIPDDISSKFGGALLSFCSSREK
jgi:hypothetical protein